MSLKTLFIVSISVLLTIVLMNNTDDINFWLFGDIKLPKLAVLGMMFAFGFVGGMLAVRPFKKVQLSQFDSPEEENEEEINKPATLSKEDEEYLR